MRSINQLITHLLVFCLGWGCIVGAILVAVNTVTLNELRANNISINTDEMLGDNPIVSLEDMTIMGAIQEYQELAKMGDEVDINLMVERYDLILPETLEKILTEEARDLPLRQLLGIEGIHMILATVYIGDIEKYQCLNADGTPDGNPKDEGSYWVTQEGKRISELEQIIANFNLDDFISGNINTDIILHGDLTLADILGYTKNEENGKFYDGNGTQVTGVMAVFAECTLDTVDDKINSAKIGELLSYTKDEKGNWCDGINEETGEPKPVHSFMAAVADESISSLGGLFETITIGQIIPEDQRQTGVISIISPDTKIEEIGTAVNDSVSDTPLQFFINQGLVDFSAQMTVNGMTMSMDKLLDFRSNPNTNGGLNFMVTFLAVDENGDEDDYKAFLKNKEYYGNIWVQDENGNYKVPAWRTKQLSASFSYIIGLMYGTVAEESKTPILKIEYADAALASNTDN